MLRAGALASRAELLRHDPDAKRIILVKSLDILNKLLEVDVPHLQAYTTKVEVLGMLGEYQQEIDTIEEIVAINNERLEKCKFLADLDGQIGEAIEQSRLEEVERLQEEYVNYAEENQIISVMRMPQDDVVELWIKQAEAYMELKEWEKAKEIILTRTPLTTSSDAMSPPRTLRCVMGLARCDYEMKRYEDAIEGSDWAIAMNRGFLGV
jgi:tetratricopeptide (TPR) repeat protein